MPPGRLTRLPPALSNKLKGATMTPFTFCALQRLEPAEEPRPIRNYATSARAIVNVKF